MLFEEMAELQDAICKNYRGRNKVDAIIEEIVDVQMMLDEMKILFNKPGTYKRLEAEKMVKLKQQLAK